MSKILPLLLMILLTGCQPKGEQPIIGDPTRSPYGADQLCKEGDPKC